MSLSSAMAAAQPPAPTPSVEVGPLEVGPLDAVTELPFDSLGLLALVTYTGFKDWKWGSASFRFNDEGWFGLGTGSGGLDKLGHAYGAYMTSELLYYRLSMVHGGRAVRSFYPALFATLLYQYIEIFDGFSGDHGYAYEDAIMNEVGVALSLARHAVPQLGNVFDYRLFYYPSGGSSFRPMIDYEGQKFFGVLRLSGIPGVERTPLRYLELLGGYYTRGFPRYAQAARKSQHVFFGIGLNLSEVITKPLATERGEPFRFLDLATRYFQSPLYVATERSRSRRR
jgi:hypothetical protein